MYLLLFAPLLNGLALPGFDPANSLNYFVPGLLVMIVFSAGFFGLNVLDDLRDGVVERLRVTPASRVGLLLGMVLQDVAVFLVNLAGLLVLFGLLALIGLTMVSASYALTPTVRDQGAVAGMMSTLTVPLLLLSGVLLPMTLAPDVLRSLAQLNPFAHAVEAARASPGYHWIGATMTRSASGAMW